MVGSRLVSLSLISVALMLAACERSDAPAVIAGGPVVQQPVADSPLQPPFAGEAKVRVGVGVADMTPDVGYCAGQYCDYASDTVQGLLNGDIDPFLTHKLKYASYGVQSRLTARAIVIEGSNGKRAVLLKSDNYLAQDLLVRRVGQLLDQGSSGIQYEDILYSVAHNHSAAYSSGVPVGVWVFEDVYDPRFFEHQARQLAAAIETAAANLKPARMGATQIHHRTYKGNVVRPSVADDGTPAGYPREYNDHGLVVLRFDDVSDPSAPKPIAVWMNWGEHPESLDGYNLHSADYLASLERNVERELGAPLVFSQADVGSAENTGDAAELLDDSGAICGNWPDDQPAAVQNACPPGQGVLRDWNHKGYVQTERNARYLADDVIKAWKQIGDGSAVIPFTGDFEVDYINSWVPGPVSHPYPSVSNCRTETTVGGDPGVPAAGLPDCFRDTPNVEFLEGPGAQLYETLKVEGIPVPDHYDAPSFGVVEENLRIHLQAFRLGDIILASCSCEAQSDLILNLESRLNTTAGDIYDGFDWACLIPEFSGDAAYANACAVQSQYFDPSDPENNPGVIPGDNFDPEAIAHVRAQVHNDARGWDDPANVLQANSENPDITQLWGNFTREEVQDLGAAGYKLAVGLGHSGDYNGYTVSYREYMNRDHYRKALTAYGAHTADYMATRLVRMAARMQGGAELSGELLDPLAQIDELRQSTEAMVLGSITGGAFDAWQAGMPNDSGAAEPLTQPTDITRFQAAYFSWRGGSTAADNPRVVVERETAPDRWQQYADQTGEVLVRVQFPQGVPGIIRTYTGMQEWIWTAAYEAYTAFPARLGSTPPGRYRFCVEGVSRKANADEPYAFCSGPFAVAPFGGIPITDVAVNGGQVSFRTAITYPRSYAESPFPYIADNANPRLCNTCTFRPWATSGQLVRAEVVISKAGGSSETRAASCDGSGLCSASLSLGSRDSAVVKVYDQDGNSGSAPVGGS